MRYKHNPAPTLIHAGPVMLRPIDDMVPMDLDLDLKTKISQGSGDVMRRFRMDGMDGPGWATACGAGCGG